VSDVIGFNLFTRFEAPRSVEQTKFCHLNYLLAGAQTLALAELESLAGALLPVLLAFFLA
jgi:hypothetical protein